MTIKQVLEAQQPHPDADFTVDGDGISQVRQNTVHIVWWTLILCIDHICRSDTEHNDSDDQHNL